MSEADDAGVLSFEERERVRLVEEYRFAVQQSLKERTPRRRGEFWIEKLLAPVVIVLLSALATGFVIPHILRAQERLRHEREISSALAEEIGQEMVKGQTALQQYADTIDSYWRETARANAMLGEFALKRDIGEMTPTEFARLDAAMENDRKRIEDRFDAGAAEYSKEIKHFRAWVRRLRVRLRVHYAGEPALPGVEQRLAQVARALQGADEQFAARQRELERAISERIEQVKALRRRFRNHELTPDAYRAEVEAVLGSLRAFDPEGRTGAVEQLETLAALITFVEQHTPRLP